MRANNFRHMVMTEKIVPNKICHHWDYSVFCNPWVNSVQRIAAIWCFCYVVQGKGSRKAWNPAKSRKINDTVLMSHSQSPPGYAKGSCCLKSVCATDLLSLHPACGYSLLHKALEM